jgi:predicted flap endonuclease-1-like 5' DNA nuclease/outer membrane murein-binding lipoprotein Lpp
MFEQNVTYGPGTGTFTQHTFEILIMLLGAFLLGLWLGWILWSKYKQAADKLALDNQSLSAAAETLRAELTATRNTLTNTQADLDNANVYVDQLTRRNTQLQDELDQVQLTYDTTKSRNRLLETELGLSFDNEAHTAAEHIPLEIEVTNQADESPVVEEPESEEPETEVTMEENTDLPLEETELDHAETPDFAMPPAADEHYEMALAGMSPAEDAENTEAFTLTTEVPHVVEPEPEVEESPKTVLAPPPAISITPVADPIPVAAMSIEPDDLTVVEGIGPKIQELLYQYGIRTYQQLAETEVDRIKEILSSAGPQLAMHDPGTWPAQANLAANNQWDNLKSIQGFLKGGKKPDK